MKFSGELKFPEIDHPGVPVTFLIEGPQAELVVEGESLGRWSLFDVHARRLVASAFQIDLDGTEVTFVADDPVDFAYRGVEHMAETWASMKSKRIASRTIAVRKSRKGTVPSRIEDMKTAMMANLDDQTSPRQIAGEVAMPDPTHGSAEEPDLSEPSSDDWDKRDQAASIPVVGAETETEPEDEVPAPAAPAPDPEVPDGSDALAEERRRLAEERAKLEEERRLAEQREADRVEAYRLEMKRLEAEREALRRQAGERGHAGTEEQEPAPGTPSDAGDESRPEPPARVEEVRETAPDPVSEIEHEPEPESVAAAGSEPEPDPEEAGVVDLSGIEERDAAETPEDETPAPPPASPSPPSRPVSRPEPVRPSPPPAEEPQPAMAGAAKDKGGLMGAVRAAFKTSSVDHDHQFIEAPGGIGITRYVCEECGYVSISA